MRKTVIIGLVLVVGVLIGNEVVIRLVRSKIYERKLTFVDSTPIEVLQELKRRTNTESDPIDLPEPRAFAEVQAFDDDAHCWSNQFSQYGAAGVLVFDANGDDRPDVYLCQDGQNWTRPTDDEGALLDGPRYQHNGLYLNQGNDKDGNPIFVQVSRLIDRNDTFVEEELLVED